MLNWYGAVISVLGICLIAIPTGIISSGLIEQLKKQNKGEGDIGSLPEETE